MTVLLVDGNWLAARAAFALPESIRARSGDPVNIVYGFFTALTKELRTTGPTALGIAFDAPGPTFRHKLCKSYKLNRVELPPSFHKQLDVLKNMLHSLGTTQCEVDELEADDVIASWVNHAVKNDMGADILSGDRDISQLVVNPLVRLLSRWGHRDGKIMSALDEEGVYARFGVWPREYVLYAALRGDQSDNLPGVPGVGPKTAAKLVRKYGSLDEIARQSGELPHKLAHNLKAGLEVARSNIQLMTLVRDACVPWPLPFFPGQIHWEDRLLELFDSIGLPRLANAGAAQKKREYPPTR